MHQKAGARRVPVDLAGPVVLAALCLGLAATATLTGAAPAARQPRGDDAALAAALVARDASSATRLLGEALKQDLGLPAGHPATTVLGPSAAANLPALLTTTQADRAASTRLNNLGVALALRGWHQSAAVAFGGALMVENRLYAARPWESALEGGVPSRIAYQDRFSATPNPAVVNVDNLRRLVGGSSPVQPGQERFEFALGLLETASAHPSMRDRLRAMAEVYPPVVSQALGDALRNRSPDGTAPMTFSRTYAGFAQYKGTFLRGLPGRRVTKPYERAQPEPAPTPAPRGQNPGGRPVWDRGEIWDDRGVYGFNPATRLRAGEALVDIYRVELGSTAADLRREYVAVVGSRGDGTSSPFKVMSLGPAGEIEPLIDAFWRDLPVDREDLDPSRLTALAARLWQPLTAVLPPGTERLWIAPDGALTRVPWQALGVLSGSASSLIVSVVDSGETIRESRPRPAQPNSRILLAANPEYGTGPSAKFVRLAASAGEASAIAEIARTKGLEPVLLDGAAVTESAIVRSLPARIVHLATHGEFRAAVLQASPLSVGSWLVFDPELARTANPRLQMPAGMDPESLQKRLAAVYEEARRNNRPVTMEDITRARDNVPELADVAQGLLALAGANALADPWTAGSPAVLTDIDLASVNLTGTDLVVLSACDLGQTQQTAFQGLGSMQSAVVVAGARALLSSLWKIPDDEAAAFMKQFYTNLLVKGLPPADALRATQQAFSRDASGRARPPFLWAGWVLFGEGW